MPSAWIEIGRHRARVAVTAIQAICGLLFLLDVLSELTCISDDNVPNPEFGDPAKCASATPPALKFPPHWAPLGFLFYRTAGFPASYQGDALVAFHGTARDQVQQLGGYLVARVRFKGGQPIGMEDLVRGWNADGDVWGRPAGLLALPDGSVLISDDLNGRIFRLRYVGG